MGQLCTWPATFWPVVVSVFSFNQEEHDPSKNMSAACQNPSAKGANHLPLFRQFALLPILPAFLFCDMTCLGTIVLWSARFLNYSPWTGVSRWTNAGWSCNLPFSTGRAWNLFGTGRILWCLVWGWQVGWVWNISFTVHGYSMIFSLYDPFPWTECNIM